MPYPRLLGWQSRIVEGQSLRAAGKSCIILLVFGCSSIAYENLVCVIDRRNLYPLKLHCDANVFVVVCSQIRCKIFKRYPGCVT